MAIDLGLIRAVQPADIAGNYQAGLQAARENKLMDIAMKSEAKMRPLREAAEIRDLLGKIDSTRQDDINAMARAAHSGDVQGFLGILNSRGGELDALNERWGPQYPEAAQYVAKQEQGLIQMRQAIQQAMQSPEYVNASPEERQKMERAALAQIAQGIPMPEGMGQAKRDIRSIGGSLVEVTSDESGNPVARPFYTAPKEVENGDNYNLMTGADGRDYWVPKEPGMGDAIPVGGIGQKPAEAASPQDVSKLRSDFEGNQTVKDFGKVADAYGRVAAAAGTPSAAGDLSLIFSFMKMLDPGSTVREGEFANAQNAAGVSGKIRAAYNNAVSGERLTPEQRQDFLAQAENLYRAQYMRAENVADTYAGYAEAAQVDPSQVVGLFTNSPRPMSMEEEPQNDANAQYLAWLKVNKPEVYQQMTQGGQ